MKVEWRVWIVMALTLGIGTSALTYYVIGPALGAGPGPSVQTFIIWELTGLVLGGITLWISKAKK